MNEKTHEKRYIGTVYSISAHYYTSIIFLHSHIIRPNLIFDR